MSSTRLTFITGIGLLVVYSVIMVATVGNAATYAWIILASGVALVVTASRRGAADNGGGHD